MPKARITSKGQITLPKAVREALAVDAGDRVAFHIGPDGRVELEADTVNVRALRGVVRPARRNVSVADMNAAISRHAAARNKG